MEIYSKANYPANALSNFAHHRFIIDNVLCYSMEGFLQSLKCKNSDMQIEICKTYGNNAKRIGSKRQDWKKTQTIHWQGQELKRNSEDFDRLITKAFDCMFEQSKSFRKALEAANTTVFTHTIGKTKRNETILTKREFCGQLIRLAKIINKNERSF